MTLEDSYSSSSSLSLDWRFSQVFGERRPGEDVRDSNSYLPLSVSLSFSFVTVVSVLEFYLLCLLILELDLLCLVLICESCRRLNLSCNLIFFFFFSF